MTQDRPAYGPPPAGEPLNAGDERMWATLADVLAIFFKLLAPLVIWIVLKDRSAFVRRNSAGAFNFQVTVAIAYFVSGLLVPVLGLGLLTGLAVAVVDLVLCIRAAVAANRGEDFRYPLQLPILH